MRPQRSEDLAALLGGHRFQAGHVAFHCFLFGFPVGIIRLSGGVTPQDGQSDVALLAAQAGSAS
jgi:hypothetical protein